jgi:hypothetical protein
MVRGRALALALVGLVIGVPASGVALPVDTSPSVYTVDARLDPDARTIAGSVVIRVTNTASRPLSDVALVLYPNRFAAPDPAVDDVNRPFIYPREDFVAGGITVDGIETASGGAWNATAPGRLEAIGPFASTLLRVPLATPLAPRATLSMRVRFTTVLPERYGPFGIADGRVTALDGWFPTLPALVSDGRWNSAIPVPPAHVTGTLVAPPSYKVFVGETLGPEPPAESFAFDVPTGSPPTLFAAEDYEAHSRDVDHAIVALAELPARRAFKLLPGESHADRVLDAVERILRERPASVQGALHRRGAAAARTDCTRRTEPRRHLRPDAACAPTAPRVPRA